MTHGTERCYVAGGCRCDDCRKAATDARRKRRQGNGPGWQTPGPLIHGYYAYRFRSCRCEVCRAANSKQHREWYARHRSIAALQAAKGTGG